MKGQLMEGVRIEPVTLDDAAEILDIYKYYVEETVITFETEVPSVEEFRERIRTTINKYPYIKAVSDGRILGYAYTGCFKARSAYDWAVETTIYLRHDLTRGGLGKLLYGELERISRLQNITNMNACIGYPEVEDEYLTRNSADFHEHMGYSLAGRFHKCGYKFGRWYDMIWMEKIIARHKDKPEAFIPWPQLRGLD
ncbi:GNAT family N-acetyltransferase [Butyrivibrio sp. MC2013]|uniref:GNAT family N-acetyltransferase n=1 Tax=Butyrivibrio sp. MC2013 TaxID=1280686 RepID=UPI001FA7F244|nr:GNAT family N-acetyltransferase [Butyrivibrio sp. MC2013]